MPLCFYYIIFLFAARFTPIIPPREAEIIVITPFKSVKRVGAERVAIKERQVKIKNSAPPKIRPVTRPFFFNFFKVKIPDNKAPMLKERVEQMLAAVIGKTPKDSSKADKTSKIEIIAVPKITPIIKDFIISLLKNFLFSKIKTSHRKLCGGF